MHAVDSLIYRHNGKHSTGLDAVMLSVRVKDFKNEIKELQRINSNRSVSAILANRYIRLYLAKALLDIKFISWIYTVKCINNRKAAKSLINNYLKYIFLNLGNENVIHNISRDLINYAHCYKYRGDYSYVKHRRYNY